MAAGDGSMSTEATLVNRLKRYGYGARYGPMAKVCADAADEIERLRHDIDRHLSICASQQTEIERLRERVWWAEFCLDVDTWECT
jgi:hypothetical protein